MSDSKMSLLPRIISMIFFFLVAIVMIILYFVFLQKSAGVVEESLKTCSNNDEHASNFINSKPNQVETWIFNLSNPLEYVNGASAEFHEIGPYGISLDIVRANPEFSKSEGVFRYDAYYDITEDLSRTCTDCNHSDLVNVPNYGYITSLGISQHEGAILLSLTCASNQIALMSSTSPIPYCTTTQRGNSSINCRCCRASPLLPGSATLCKDLLTPTSRAGGIMSYLSQHDHGLKIANKMTSFPFSNGIYTSLVRQLTVNEVLWGHASTLLGALGSSQAYNAGISATNAQKITIKANQNTTRDFIDACYFNSTICPSVATVASGIIPLFKNHECKGRVPSTAKLIDNGLTPERAHELKYLEGVSCKPLTPTIIIAAVLQKDASSTKSWQCADGSTQLPCCLKVFHSYTYNLHGSGLGCLQWVGGLLQLRRVYSDEEALNTLGPLREEVGTACASKEDQFQMQMYKGMTSTVSWYTPPTDSYPNMTWADSTLMKPGLSGTGTGAYSYFNFSGEIFGLHEGKGFEPQFLSKQLLKDESPLKDSLSIWVPFRRSVVEYLHQKQRVLQGITTNSYQSHYTPTTDDEMREMQQKQGMTPYQNMASLYYASGGRPLIMSSPNYFNSDVMVLSQSDNLPRKSNLTTGIQIYQTHDGYTPDSSRLTTPRVMTTDTWETYGLDYSGHLSLEPATGITLDGVVVNQVSTFTWNCNPKIDPTCGFFYYNKTTSQGKLCYRNGLNYYPCSAANVFTPRVMGGKVLPVFWLRASPVISSTVFDALHDLQQKSYLSGVLVLVIPIVSFVIILGLLISILTMKQHSQVATITVIELKPVTNNIEKA